MDQQTILEFSLADAERIVVGQDIGLSATSAGDATHAPFTIAIFDGREIDGRIGVENVLGQECKLGKEARVHVVDDTKGFRLKEPGWLGRA
jgi:hypothetical protein